MSCATTGGTASSTMAAGPSPRSIETAAANPRGTSSVVSRAMPAPKPHAASPPAHPDVALPLALPGLVARLAYFVAARAAADAGGAVVGQALVRLRACLAKTLPGNALA